MFSEPSRGAFCEQPAGRRAKSRSACSSSLIAPPVAPPRRAGTAACRRRRALAAPNQGYEWAYCDIPHKKLFPGAESVLATSPGCEMKREPFDKIISVHAPPHPPSSHVPSRMQRNDLIKQFVDLVDCTRAPSSHAHALMMHRPGEIEHGESTDARRVVLARSSRGPPLFDRKATTGVGAGYHGRSSGW